MSNTKTVQIEELYVVVGKDSNGNEGIAIGLSDTGQAEPLLGGRRRVPRILELAQVLANESGQELHLVKFSQRGTLETVTPDAVNKELA